MATNDLSPARLPTNRSRWRTIAAVVAGLTLAGGITTAGAAPRAQAVGELPPVTISSTTLRAGETVTISGTGCIDPDTGSGEGLEVVLLVPVDSGRGGIATIRPTVRAGAQADGSFEGSGVIEQPLFPDGAQTGIFSCQEESEDGFPPVVAQREVQLTIEAPSLPDLTVAAGSTFEYTLPCTIGGGEYGRFVIVPDGLDEFSFLANGSFPQETSPQKGEQVTLEVPAELAPGTYDATASCLVSQAGTSAYFSGFTVTVTAADPSTPTPSPTPGPAPTPTPGPAAPGPTPTPSPSPDPAAAGAATPVAGAPNFTG